MPENTAENEIIPMREGPEMVPVETAKEKFEREQMTRRQALKRFGMTSAMAAFALFSVDDLAHMVGKAMQQRAGDNKVANQVAKEFQSAGIAMATYPPSSNCYGCYPGDQCVPGKYQVCQKCCGGCSCMKPVDQACGPSTLSFADCQACCKDRNPNSVFWENNCKSAGHCT